MDFEQSYNSLLNEYDSKQTIPGWFITGYKTLLSKNVTIEDWNKMYLYLQNLASDDEVLLKILKLIKTNMPTKVSDLENDAKFVNSNELTNAISDKLVKSNVGNSLYGVSLTGEQQNYLFAYEPQALTIPNRGFDGELLVNEIPNLDNEAVSKKYVDDTTVRSVNISHIVYGNNPYSSHKYYFDCAVLPESSPDSHIIPLRGLYGELLVRDIPTISNEAVSKSYVDGLIPTKVSDLANDKNFATTTYVDENLVITNLGKLNEDFRNAQHAILNSQVGKGFYIFIDGTSIDNNLYLMQVVSFYETRQTYQYIYAGDTLYIRNYNPNTSAWTVSKITLATTAYVDTKIANLVNSAPEALDTLGELAVALENHENVYDALLETVGNKANASDVPTKTSQLTNDSTFINQTQLDEAIPTFKAGDGIAISEDGTISVTFVDGDSLTYGG